MYTFDANTEASNIINWIRNWFDHNGKDSPAVIGISGGKDSSTVAALCVKALGKDRVIGVKMPNGKQSDIDYANGIIEYLGIKSYEVNIHDTYEAVLEQLKVNGITPSKQTIVNLPPRLRMATLYAISQSVNGRVSRNCNLSEDMTGYSTRYGDDAGDFAPLRNLTVQEVKAVGKAIGVPDQFIEKTPSDGLQAKTDEDNLGFLYAELDTYIREGKAAPELEETFKTRFERIKFKLEEIATYRNDLPNYLTKQNIE